MVEAVNAERAERVSKGRANIMAVAGVVMLGASFGAVGTPSFSTPGWRSGAWLLTVLLWMILLANGGGFRLKPRMRALINDELSLQNRSRAFAAGFYAMVAAALAVYVASWWIQLGPQDALRIVVACGLSVALLRYAGLERR